MNTSDLSARLSATIYPVMLSAGVAWGATGKPSSGLATLALALLVLAVRLRQPPAERFK